MKAALFIFPNLLGHLNPTARLAKQLVEKNWDVVYCGRKGMLVFTIKNQFKLHALSTLPYLQRRDLKKGQSKLKSWFLNFKDRWGNKRFEERQRELAALLKRYKPEIIFLDTFYYSDFLIIHHIDPTIRCIFLDVRFPPYFTDGFIPPSNTFAFPGKENLKIWQKYFRVYFFKALWKNIIYLGKNDLKLLTKKFKELNTPTEFSIITKKLYCPAFKNIEEWFLFPSEIDFPGQKLFAWQKYVPLGVDPERFEVVNQNVNDFILKKDSVSGSKLIYCSLGTVTDVHSSSHKKASTLPKFYQILIDIAILEPQFHFIIVIDKKRKGALKNMPGNVYLTDFIPQVHVLKNANLMINHGGGSINEAAYFGVPMFILPINNKWDFNGNAARVVFHGLGLTAHLNDPIEKINGLIKKILFDVEFTRRANEKAKEISKSIKEFNLDQHLYSAIKENV